MNTIIEVSSSNADVKSETSLTTVMSPPIVMATPTTLTFNEGFIDLRSIGNSGSDSFILSEDTNVELRVAFYEVFNGQITNVNDDDTSGNNKRFSAFNNGEISNTDQNYLGGVYAMYQVEYREVPNVLKFPANPVLNFTANPPPAFVESITLIEETNSFTIPAGTYTSSTIIQTLNDQFQGAFYRDTDFYKATGLEIGTERNPFYRPMSFFEEKYTEYITGEDVFKKAIIFIRVDENPIKMTFATQDGATYYYPQKTGDFQTQVMIGCPIVSLQDTDDIISFAYAHNPVYKVDEGSGDRDEYIQLKYKGTPADTFYWEYARGGICFTSLQPESFWGDLLGFSTQEFTLNITPITGTNIVFLGDFINITGKNSVASSTTRPYIGVSDVDNYVNDGIVDKTILTNTAFTNLNPADYAATKELQTLAINNTVAIKAKQPIQFAQFNSGGHYRIEIDIGYYINNFNSAKTKKSIACLASREYLTNGFLSIFSGGQPISLPAGSVLSYITINILDPITGKPATNIGSNNSFYFSLTS